MKSLASALGSSTQSSKHIEGTPAISTSKSPNIPARAPASLAANLLRVVLAIYLSLAILLTLGQLALEYQNEKQRLTEEIENAATTFSPIISQALWNVDEEQTKASLLGVLGINYDVLNVQLLDADGMLLYEFDSPADKHTFSKSWPWAGQLADLFLERYVYGYDLFYESDFTTNRKIGRLVLKSNSNVVLSRAAHTFLITIISAMFKTSLLAVIFYVIMRRMVGRPLKQITSEMQQLNPKHSHHTPEEDYDPELLSRDDELGAMARTFREMARSLKQKDKAINAYSNHLEAKVQERTRQLEQASQAKSDFLASVSHEIRTPMNGVIGLAHLLGETELSAQQSHYVDVIQSSGESLINIINEILDHLKMESNKIELEYTIFNLEDLFHECVALFSHRAREADITVLALFSPQCPQYVNGDPTRVRQILTNLLGNAFKFTSKGTITVKSEIEEAEGSEPRVTISVIDTGIGIEQSQLPRLFKPFSQADSSTTRRYGGTGLGLAICKQLVELMGGSIDVQSSVGEGSHFRFQFPLKPASCSRPAVSSVHLPKDTQVLLLFSNELYSKHLELLLKQRGVQQKSFKQRDQFLQYLPTEADNTLAVIECSSTISEVDGPSSFDFIGKLRARSDIPVLLINAQTNCANDGVAKTFEKIRILQTPFSNASFLQVATELLTGIANIAESKTRRKAYRNLSALNVLVAEDNPVNQMVIAGYLRKYSIEPMLVDNGLQAIEYCKCYRNNIDLILMDGEMPELDGWEAAKRIRSMSTKGRDGRPVTIIALSAHAMEIYKQKATQFGMNGFLCKPINHLELERILMAAYTALPPAELAT